MRDRREVHRRGSQRGRGRSGGFLDAGAGHVIKRGWLGAALPMPIQMPVTTKNGEDPAAQIDEELLGFGVDPLAAVSFSSFFSSGERRRAPARRSTPASAADWWRDRRERGWGRE